MNKTLFAAALSVMLIAPFSARAEVKDPLLQKLMDKGTLTKEEAEDIQSRTKLELPKPLQGLKVGALFYFDYSFGEKNKNGTNFNEFKLTRGYININKEITPWFRARITPDITQIFSGDYELRMKYLYADFLPPDLGPSTGNTVRVGLGHTPWLDFQEHINIYRMQGVMFQERFGNFNSSDSGIGLIANIGESLTKEQQESVGYSTTYAGRYGSYHIGVYNGGGYHAAENNENKVIEGRLTLRPLPDMIPGLQLTYAGISGKGNASTSPTWRNNTGFVSYQNKMLVLSAEYAAATGQQNGADTKKKGGYSFFGDCRLPMYDKVSVFARYDVWDPDRDVTNDKQFLTIAGAAYRITGSNYLVAVFEKMHNQPSGQLDDRKGQIVLQVSF